MYKIAERSITSTLIAKVANKSKSNTIAPTQVNSSGISFTESESQSFVFPGHVKATINTGVARAARDASELVKPSAYLNLLGMHTLLHPNKAFLRATFARKSIANWSLRAGMPIGLRCTMLLAPGDVLYLINAYGESANKGKNITSISVSSRTTRSNLKASLFVNACNSLLPFKSSVGSVGISDIFASCYGIRAYDFLRFSRGYNFKSALALASESAQGPISREAQSSKESVKAIPQRNTRRSSAVSASVAGPSFGFNISFGA